MELPGCERLYSYFKDRLIPWISKGKPETGGETRRKRGARPRFRQLFRWSYGRVEQSGDQTVKGWTSLSIPLYMRSHRQSL